MEQLGLAIGQAARAPSLREAVYSLGYTAGPARKAGVRDILLDGAVVFTGDNEAIWVWVKAHHPF